LLKPPDFDPAKKYPVWTFTYAGPHMPSVRDSFNGSVQDQALATAGIVVFRVDPRSASGKGVASAWTAYKQLGVQETKDLDDAMDWLTGFPWVDAKRLGLSGHSYGGYMTAYALTHSKKFAAGIAGAPVTDWRNYDTIYTERYMGTPQDNPQGYDDSSVVKAAKNLHGRLLLLHGEMDDNVHVQNTLQLIDALQKAEKDVEVMIYPRARHGLGPTATRQIVQFIIKNMTGVEPKLPTSGGGPARPPRKKGPGD
jgi:dipeptidyl-peptidase 4